jgi:Gram-negative bacterial TonB protein C-terminal
MAVISDTGFVCDVQVLKGIDKNTDADAIAAVKNGKFKAATKDGRPVPTVVTLDVRYERKDGKLVRAVDSPFGAQQTSVN